MGFAIADEATRRGAVVTLIAGPTTAAEPTVHELIRVRGAEEMQRGGAVAFGRCGCRRDGRGGRRLHPEAPRSAEGAEGRRTASRWCSNERPTSSQTLGRPPRRQRQASSCWSGLPPRPRTSSRAPREKLRREAGRSHRRQRRVPQRRRVRRGHERGHARRRRWGRGASRCSRRRASPRSSSTASSVCCRASRCADSTSRNDSPVARA